MNMQKSVVIKYGGNAMTEPDIRKKVLAAAVKLKNKGIIPVLVHGGGPYINKALNERGRESKFLKGLRCTDKDTMEVVIQVLCGSVNKGLTAEIESLGSRAIGLSGADGGMIKAVRYSDDKELGFAGKVSSIQSDVIELALNNGYIPVISSVGYDIHGQAYNINADMVAGHIGASTPTATASSSSSRPPRTTTCASTPTPTGTRSTTTRSCAPCSTRGTRTR